MNVGQTFRAGFENMLRTMGETIIIHRQHNDSLEVQGMKNNHKGKPKEVMFQFLEDPGISIGDTLQQKGAREHWRVIHVSDEVISGVYINFEADVESTTRPAKRSTMQSSNVTIHGSVLGALQINSPHANQSNSVQISLVTQHVKSLKELVSKSELSDLDKEDAILALNRIEELSERPKNPDLLARIQDKIQSVDGIIKKGSQLAIDAAPFLTYLWETFGSR